MNMKLIVLGITASLFGLLALPATTLASPALTESNLLAVGVSITAKNTGTMELTGNTANIQCSNAHFVGTLTKNSGTLITIEVPVGGATFTGSAAGNDCTSTVLGATKVTITSKLCLATVPKTDEVIVTGCGADVILKIELTQTGAKCSYDSPAFGGTYKTNADATFNFLRQPGELTEGGFLCPDFLNFDMDLDLLTTNGTVLTIS